MVWLPASAVRNVGVSVIVVENKNHLGDNSSEHTVEVVPDMTLVVMVYPAIVGSVTVQGVTGVDRSRMVLRIGAEIALGLICSHILDRGNDEIGNRQQQAYHHRGDEGELYGSDTAPI